MQAFASRSSTLRPAYFYFTVTPWHRPDFKQNLRTLGLWSGCPKRRTTRKRWVAICKLCKRFPYLKNIDIVSILKSWHWTITTNQRNGKGCVQARLHPPLCMVSTIPWPFCRGRFAVAVPNCRGAVTAFTSGHFIPMYTERRFQHFRSLLQRQR